MRLLTLLGLVSFATVAAMPAIAAPVMYNATSATSDSLHAGNSDHSLWMPMFESLAGTALNGNSNGSDFDFVPDGKFSIATDGSATLSGTVRSQVDSDFSFDVLLSFVGLAGPGSGGPKKELKSSAYVANGGPIDHSTWSYFRLVDGTISGAGSASGLSFDVLERPSSGAYPGQFGVGANGKNGDLGFSVWFYTVVNNDCVNSLCATLARRGPQAGDVNIDLSEVPLPAGMLLFATGLAGLATRRRRG